MDFFATLDQTETELAEGLSSLLSDSENKPSVTMTLLNATFSSILLVTHVCV